MALTIDNNKNMYLKQDDAVDFIIYTKGRLKAEIGNTAVFMIKNLPSDSDASAVFTLNINIVENEKIGVEMTSLETSVIPNGTYYWSVKLFKDPNYYTIVPNNGNDLYPQFVVEETLIHD